MNGSKEYEKVIDYILRKIELRELEIGSGLPSERQISAELGIGRNSVREGLRTLENMGVVTSHQGSGNYISGDMSKSFIQGFNMMVLLRAITMKEITEFRRSTELALYELAFQNSAKRRELLEMGQVLADFENNSLEEQISLDNNFHFLLVSMANNTMLSMIMNTISEVYGKWVANVIRLASPEERRKLHQAHEKIYGSLIILDKVAGLKAIEDHYLTIDAIAQRIN